MKNNNSIELIKTEKKNSRILKVSELIKRTLAEIFLSKSFTDDRGQNFMIFISEVLLSADAKLASVFITNFSANVEIDQKVVLDSLEKDLGKIKREFSSKIDLRYTPKLRFKIDVLSQESSKVDEIFKTISK